MRVLLTLCLLCVSTAVMAEEAKPTLTERLQSTASEHRYALHHDAGVFGGPAWEQLLSEGAKAQFFLLGEEHGIAENAEFAGALYAALTKSGYDRFAIEISPPLASALDQAAAAGLESLREFLNTPGQAVAFFGMAEEAQLLVDVRAATAGSDTVLWGLDYEVLADRYLLAQLQTMDKPEAAQQALDVLSAASAQSWERYAEERSPQYIYSFAGDPQLVQALRRAWPQANAEARRKINTLEQTLRINQLWVQGQGLASNQHRADFNRANFIDYWRAEREAGRMPKVVAKFGASHMVRGRSMTEVFDLGSLMAETAALHGGHSFHLLVLPGVQSQVARFDPTTLRVAPAPAKDSYAKGLEVLLPLAPEAQFTLFDLRPLRPLLGRQHAEISAELMRIVHGFDALLLMNGSTPSGNL